MLLFLLLRHIHVRWCAIVLQNRQSKHRLWQSLSHLLHLLQRLLVPSSAYRFCKIELLTDANDRSAAQESLQAANTMFRSIVRVQLILLIMSELWSNDSYSGRHPSSQILSTLKATEEIQTIHDLCALHRACTLSQVRIKAAMPNAIRATSSSTVTSPQIPTDGDQATFVTVATDATLPMTPVQPAAAGNEWSEDKLKNGRTLRAVFASIPDSVKMFLQGVMSLQTARRTPVDHAVRKDATYVANAIATGIAESLRWPATGQSCSIMFCCACLTAVYWQTTTP